MTPHDLMEAARALAEPDHGRPTQARLRRAVSSVYYAMFHTLAETAADLFMGEARSPAWHRVYRALEHGRARSACQQERIMREFPAGIREFAKTFVVLQTERQKADYALDRKPYETTDVLEHIGSAERAIDRFARVDVESRRNFVAHVLFRQRAIGGSR